MNGEVTFRRAVVGGFNRNDVMEYISNLSSVNNEQKKLRTALRESEATVEKLKAELDVKEKNLAEAAQGTDGEQQKLSTALKESEATVEKLKAELEAKNDDLAKAAQEIAALKVAAAEAEQLKLKLQQYESKTAGYDDTADKLMRESMAYADRYVESANLMASNIRKETLVKVKDADSRVKEMLEKAAVFSKECEDFGNVLNFFKSQLEEIKKTFEE